MVNVTDRNACYDGLRQQLLKRQKARISPRAKFRLPLWTINRYCAVQSPCPLWVISGHIQCKKACPLYPESGHVRCN